MDAAAGALSFFALGIVTFTSAAVLLISPRNPEIRWFVAFNLSVMTWLLGQGLVLSHLLDRVPFWTLPAVALMPCLFVAMAAADASGPRADWLPWVATAVGATAALLVGLGHAGISAAAIVTGPLLTVLHVVGWTGGCVLLLRHERLRGDAWTARRGVLALALLTPVAVVGAQLFGARQVIAGVVPALLVVTYIALFAGIARLRFYDVEVRAARSGELAAEAAEHARLAVLGEMAASFAHEVRNPLTGVRSLAQRLAEDVIDEGRRRRYAGVILAEVGRVEHIVEDLLAVSRRLPVRDAQGGSTPLEALFEDVALLTSARARRHGVLILCAAHGLGAAAPREALAQALLNLVLNALAHSPQGGVIRLSAARVGEHVAITVSDQGPGVPPDERNRIFEPFHSARPDGIGLGLSVVRTLARDLGWSISVGDAPGGGASFRIAVPASSESHAAMQSETTVHAPATGAK